MQQPLTIKEKILKFYSKNKYGNGIYSTNNPISIYEVLYKVTDPQDVHNKYTTSTFCKSKHEELQKRYYGYSFHCLTAEEMKIFINEVSKM